MQHRNESDLNRLPLWCYIFTKHTQEVTADNRLKITTEVYDIVYAELTPLNCPQAVSNFDVIVEEIRLQPSARRSESSVDEKRTALASVCR